METALGVKILSIAISLYSFGRLVVHAMNADYPVRGFPRQTANAGIDPGFSKYLKLKSSPKNDDAET